MTQRPEPIEAMTREPPATLESIIDQVGNQAAGRSDGCLCMASERALAAEIQRLTSLLKDRLVLLKDAYAGNERLLDALKAIECHSIDHTDACRMAGKARAALEPKP